MTAMTSLARSPESFQNGILAQELALSSLAHEVARALLSAGKLAAARETLLLGTAEITGAQRILLLTIPEDSGGEYLVAHSLGYSPDAPKAFRLGSLQGHENWLPEQGHLWVDKAIPGDPFSVLNCEQYLLMPITIPQRIRQGMGKAIALLWMDTSPPAPPLTAQGISHLSELCLQAGWVLENFRIRGELTMTYRGLKKTNRAMDKANHALQEAQRKTHDDLERARELQTGLLPKSIPSHLLRDFSARYLPAGQVGGDYYDCFETTPGRLGIVIADVSGHGAAAALIMTMFKVLLKTLAPQKRSPARVLERINQSFLEDLDGRHFVTVFYAVFDRDERTLTYSSAGHLPQLLIQPDSSGAPLATELTSHGLVLGMFSDFELEETCLQLAPESRLVLFTDGITEAHGKNGMFGVEPIRELALKAGVGSAEDLGLKVMESLTEFRTKKPPGGNEEKSHYRPEDDLSDDATLVILEL